LPEFQEESMQLNYRVASGADKPIAIVTGASRRQGIGAAICRLLAESGVSVFFTGWSAFDASIETGIDADGPDALLQEILDLGVTGGWEEVDLADPEAPAAIFKAAESVLGPVSILINNAAHSTSDSWQTLDAATLDAHYQVNLRATALMTVEFARRWSSGPGGRVVSLTSGQFKGPMLGEIAYASTKGAIDAFTVTMAAELASHGITVNAVGPGPTDTGWMTDKIKEVLLPKHPLGRFGMPSDIAKLVAFLVSEQGEWVTGQIIHSEGGFLRR
jgi:3-oxoacyl-[acyl-carrier protein] reductase